MDTTTLNNNLAVIERGLVSPKQILLNFFESFGKNYISYNFYESDHFYVVALTGAEGFVLDELLSSRPKHINHQVNFATGHLEYFIEKAFVIDQSEMILTDIKSKKHKILIEHFLNNNISKAYHNNILIAYADIEFPEYPETDERTELRTYRTKLYNSKMAAIAILKRTCANFLNQQYEQD